MKWIFYFFVFILLVHHPCFSQDVNSDDHKIDGKASYYSKSFQGRKTANGEIFNYYDYTAAHRSFPFNTYLNVINKSNNFNIIVRVNDRGPYAKNRIIDLSEAAARRIGGYNHGLVQVKVEVLDIIQLTPELDSAFHASAIVDCLGNVSTLQGITLSLWSTEDLVHAIYIATDLYIKEDVNKVLIGTKIISGKNRYHILVTGIENKKKAMELKDHYERKGFMKVGIYKP
ncbi:MAG TPA: septal ring lytic transglycosylase RlpA family protein [Bacteroidia bacterium]|nr:septal ring lytic transglycosylase RlpA family protein [Bacteroidia bacterium]